MYERVLVPTDGSELAAAAMEHALDIAATYGAHVTVLHVIDTRRYDVSIESTRLPLEERGSEFVQRLVDAADEAGVAVDAAIEDGRPARVVLEYADENDVDLIVMGTRGRGGLEARLLGSVTDYVVRHADVPVMVVAGPRTAT